MNRAPIYDNLASVRERTMEHWRCSLANDHGSYREKKVLVDLRPILPALNLLTHQLDDIDFDAEYILDQCLHFIEDLSLKEHGLDALVEEMVRQIANSTRDPTYEDIERFKEHLLFVANYLVEIFTMAGVYRKDQSLGWMQFDKFKGSRQQEASFTYESAF